MIITFQNVKPGLLYIHSQIDKQYWGYLPIPGICICLCSGVRDG